MVGGEEDRATGGSARIAGRGVRRPGVATERTNARTICLIASGYVRSMLGDAQPTPVLGKRQTQRTAPQRHRCPSLSIYQPPSPRKDGSRRNSISLLTMPSQATSKSSESHRNTQSQRGARPRSDCVGRPDAACRRTPARWPSASSTLHMLSLLANSAHAQCTDAGCSCTCYSGNGANPTEVWEDQCRVYLHGDWRSSYNGYTFTCCSVALFPCPPAAPSPPAPRPR